MSPDGPFTVSALASACDVWGGRRGASEPACAATGDNNGCRPNQNYANNNQYSSVGSSDYNALHISFVQLFHLSSSAIAHSDVAAWLPGSLMTASTLFDRRCEGFG